MRVLIVEDYAPQRAALTLGLEDAGWAVDATGDGVEGLWFGRSHPYDLIVLDLMLPGLDGFSILKTLRAEGKTTPVLILTAKDAVADRVRGLDLGADDYLVKPFAFDEFLARVRALARRGSQDTSAIVQVEDLRIDTASRKVARGDETIELSAREYALLLHLARRAGELVTRQDIWEHTYDFSSETNSNVVDVYIGYLRKKLERDGAKRLIHTKRGHGYVLGGDP